MYITEELLRSKDACLEQVQLFLELFPRERYPDGVEVTVDACVEHAKEFDWFCARDNLLSPAGVEAFNEMYVDARKAHIEMMTSAQKVHIRVTDWARENFDKVHADAREARGDARKAYLEVTALACKILDEARTSANKAYTRALARAFALAADL